MMAVIALPILYLANSLNSILVKYILKLQVQETTTSKMTVLITGTLAVPTFFV